MSWFQERVAYKEHMAYRKQNPDRYVVKYGTNKHPDHSNVLSTDLSYNQKLVDTLFYQVMSLLPSQKWEMPKSIEIEFAAHWEEHQDNDCSVIGLSLNFSLAQFGKELRKGRLLLTNWGNRGEPASVYEDAFSRFFIFEIQKKKSTTRYEGLTQYGFHKFLNAKYKKLLPDHKLLGVKKEVKPAILSGLEKAFEFKITGDMIKLPSVEIHSDNDEPLTELIKKLILIGMVKEHCRGRFEELVI